MKFSPGDKIALKATAEEGVFVRSMDKKMVMISINNTEFPVFETEIEHPYFNWFTDKNFLPQKTEKIFVDNIAKEKNKSLPMSSMGMHLVFMPVYKNILYEDVVEKVKVYLSNNQAQGYGFHYYFESKSGETFTFHSEVAAHSDFYIHDIAYEDLATNPLFDISCAEIISNITSGLNQYQEKFTIKPKKIFELILQMHQQEKAFFVHYLFNSAPELAIAEEHHVTPWSPAIKQMPKKPVAETEKTIIAAPAPLAKPMQLSIDQYFSNPFEIDLHIEKLFEGHAEMNASEKINFQLSIFQLALESAIVKGQDTLIVIHGVGKGVLKNQIHSVLNQTKEVHSYVNNHDIRYGFGATEIFLRY
jgi:Smr domain